MMSARRCRVTGIEVILAALAVGAAAGVADTTKAVVVDAYAGLRDALRRRLAGHQRATEALEAVEAEPGVWRAELEPELERLAADQDADVLAAAHRLLRLVDPDGSAAGKYQVDAREAKGLQVGDHNVQHNTFS
jgi:hypothetical protein